MDRHRIALAAAAIPPPAAAEAASSVDIDEEENLNPWEREGFVPMTASGKQKSPNAIRGELQRYIDASTETQQSIIGKLGVNSNSFRKFMNPKTYKDQWSACQNGTYWAAARLLEQDRWEKKQAKKAAAKRKSPSTGEASSTGTLKKTKVEESRDAQALMDSINAVEGVDTSKVYDSCPEVVKKIKAFLAIPGVSKAAFCRALGGINSNSLGPFLMGKKQDQCANVTYVRAYAFFEQKRVMDGGPKTKKRLKNEIEHPHGFSTEKQGAGTWSFQGTNSFC